MLDSINLGGKAKTARYDVYFTLLLRDKNNLSLDRKLLETKNL